MMSVFLLVEIAACFIEQFVFYRVLSLVFHERKRKASFLGTVIGTCIVMLCNRHEVFSMVTVALMVIYSCVCGYIVFRKELMTIFSLVLFYYLCIGCLEFFTASLISRLQGGEYILVTILEWGMPRVWFVLFMKALLILGYFILKKLVHTIEIHMHNVYGMLVVTAGGFIGFVYLMRKTFLTVTDATVNAWFFLMLFVGFLFFLWWYFGEIKEQKKKLDYEQMRNALLEESYQNISEIYSRNAKLYHDLNNHLNTLYHLVDQGSMEETKAYIQQISEPVQMLSRTVWTGVDIVDVVINSKADKMDGLGIAYQINAEFPKNTNVLPNDICTILANLLDNAIEAVQQLKSCEDEKESVIELTIRRIKRFLIIRVANPCVGKNEMDRTLPTTTKSNPEMHGWGLKSVMSVVEKYDGTLDCQCESGKFTATVILFFKENK